LVWECVNLIFSQSELYNIVVGTLQSTDCTCYLLHLIPLSATCGRSPLKQSSACPLETVNINFLQVIFLFCSTAPCGPEPAHCRSFTITPRHPTLGRTPLDDWSARSRDLYLTTHNTHNRQTSVLPVGFEPAVTASERRQTYGLDRSVTITGTVQVQK